MKKLIRISLFMTAFAIVAFILIVFVYVYADINPQHFLITENQTYRVSDDGKKIPIITSFQEDFESVDDIIALVHQEQVVFNSFVLQSPSTPTIESYVEHRKCLIKGGCNFIDNRVDISEKQAYNGSKSLRFYAVPPPEGIVSKSLLENTLLHITEGDDIWYSAWYYIEEGWPSTLADFETSAMKWGPGPRVTLFSKKGGLAVELKHGLKPTYKQDAESRLDFPTKKWVHVAVHFKLSASSNGKIELWQDCQKVIDKTGKTLPKKSAVLDRVQVGITATDSETVLYVDDISFATEKTESFMPHCKVI